MDDEHKDMFRRGERSERIEPREPTQEGLWTPHSRERKVSNESQSND